MAPLAVAMYMSTQTNEQEAKAECEASRADRIRGNYENKIRFFASPEKVFDIFSTEEDDDVSLMSYEDFLHCMTPYNNGELLTHEDIKEYLKENKMSVLQYVDADGSGTISYTEFVFFLTLHQVPPARLRKMFKRANDKMDK